MNVPPSPANGLAFVVSTLFSYLLNTLWSFSRPLSGDTLRRFIVVSIIGCLLAMGISGLASHAGLDYLPGIGLVVLMVPPMTFVMHSLWTYRHG